MADLDFQEMAMFAKWYGSAHLESKPEFWADCMERYHEKTVKLPLHDSPAEREMVAAMVKCPPGKCGVCCHYPKVEMTEEERQALEAISGQRARTTTGESGKLCLDISGGCQFLTNNVCTVYESRPLTCRAFPILRPREVMTEEGTKTLQMQMRLKCPPALEAIKNVLTQACADGKLMLLPDLSLVPAQRN